MTIAKVWNKVFNSEYDMSGKYSASDVALYLIQKCVEDGKPISNLQLQKILYYIQKYFLQEKKYALFSDDMEAWQFGPVVSEIYWRYCGFGSSEIFEVNDSKVTFENDEKKSIDSILEEKRAMKPWDLVGDTHKEGKPWSIIYRNGRGNKQVIPKGVIAQYG